MDELADARKKNARNARVMLRYDELMRAGRHGHYETMFQIVREECERAVAEAAFVKTTGGVDPSPDPT